ncbi:unnamed protein product [Rotaria sp. Silwood1]|nr:unnamed protein product [Rotaria sp. Silwood1]
MCAKHHHISDRQILANYTYKQPQIITEPKSDWHYRSLKDLLKNHIPLLSGEGPQRTPIRVQIPEKSMRPMYLAIAVVTQDHKFHDSKVIVPPKTQKTINRSRVSQPIRNHKNPFYQLSIDFVDDSSPDNKNDDSDHDMDC